MQQLLSPACVQAEPLKLLICFFIPKKPLTLLAASISFLQQLYDLACRTQHTVPPQQTIICNFQNGKGLWRYVQPSSAHRLARVMRVCSCCLAADCCTSL